MKPNLPTDLASYWKDLFHSDKEPSAEQLLADNIALHSPIMHTPQTGKALVAKYIIAAYKLYNDNGLQYVRDFQKGNEAMLEFEGEINGVAVNGVDIIRWNDHGEIEDFKILVRPLKGLDALAKTMVKQLDDLGVQS